MTCSAALDPNRPELSGGSLYADVTTKAPHVRADQQGWGARGRERDRWPLRPGSLGSAEDEQVASSRIRQQQAPFYVLLSKGVHRTAYASSQIARLFTTTVPLH